MVYITLRRCRVRGKGSEMDPVAKFQAEEQARVEAEKQVGKQVFKSQVVDAMRERRINSAKILEMVGMTQDEAAANVPEFLFRAGAALELR